MTKPNITERKSCNMFQNNYTENSFLLKGLILKNLKIDEITETVIAQVEMPVKEHNCPHCGNITTYIKDYRIQKIRDLPIIDKPLIVFFRKRRYICKICNATFTENNDYIKRYSHFPCRFYMTAIKEVSTLQSFTSIAKRMHISVSSVIRWFNNISFPIPKLPSCISIDEFRGNAGGEKFQCNIADPVNHKTIDILPSRKAENLYRYFHKFSQAERLSVRTVVMDLSPLFRSVVKNSFYNAEIIADKFHVIRLVKNSMENVRKRVQKQFHHEKRRWLKRSRSLLSKNESKLTTTDKIELNRILNSSSELEKAYLLNKEFQKIFYQQDKNAAKKALSMWLLLAAKFDIPEFKHCISTFTNWSTEITNIVNTNLSNGFIEGYNNKIKVLKRVSFGIKNFARLRNRILFLQ